MFANLAEKARSILKSLNEGEAKGEGKDQAEDQKKNPVPEPPADPDRLDSRVGDASPTSEDLDKAKESGDDAGADADQGDDFNEFGHKDMDPEEFGGDDAAAESKPDKESADDEGDDEGREIKKGLAEVGHMEPTDTLEDITEPDMNALFLELLQELKSQNNIIAKLTQTVAELEAGFKGQGRELKKALADNATLQSRFDKLHETVPASAAPRAITKALGSDGADAPLSRAQVQALAESGKLSSLEVALLCQRAAD